MAKKWVSNWKRYKEPSILLKQMFAHEGHCEICGGIVKMYRDSTTYRLKPEECQCIACGQYYHMEIPDIDAWEKEQWDQKIRRK